MSNAHDYLPSELWELIAKYLKNPHDLKSLSEVSPYFFHLLQPKRTKFLLQLVLPILGDYQYEYARRVYYQRLPVNVLLNFRLVSKSCNQSVTYYFQKHLHRAKCFIDERSSPSSCYSDCESISHARDIRLSLNWYSCRRIRTLLDTAQVTHPPSLNAIPILTRSLVLSTLSWVLDGAEILTTVTRLLELYGGQLLHLTFKFESYTIAAIEGQYAALKDCLSLVPNLNTLVVHFNYPDRRDFIIQQNVIDVNPLPQLPHLSKLTTRLCPSQIQQVLLQTYCHVESLILEFPDDVNSGNFKQVHWLLNLKELMVTVRTTNDMEALDICLGPEQPWPRLQKVEMNRFQTGLNNTTTLPRWAIIISFLNKNFGGAERLVNLALRAPHSNPERNMIALALEDTQKCRLKLRHVEQLKLFMSEMFLLDFILPMKNSLKKLAVWSRVEGKCERGDLPTNQEVNYSQKIAWNGWLGQSFIASNLWTTFHNLDFVRVQKRRGWIYRRRISSLPVCIGTDGKAAEYDENVSEDEEEVS